MDTLDKRSRNSPGEQCFIDRLSPLPDEMLHHIFSFLDVLDSVRTSVLSRRWMNVWLSAPCRNFSMSRYIEHFDDSSVNEKLGGRYMFWEFINWALIDKAVCPIRRISLSFDDTMVEQINALLLLAAKLEVQEICLRDGDIGVRKLVFPGALCENLTSLTIDFRDIIALRAATYFSKLRSLYLRGVVLSDDMVKKLFSRDSSYLEDVHLEGCKFKDSEPINICGNNLKNLTIANMYCFSDALWILSMCKYSLNVCAPNLVSFTYIGPMLRGFNLCRSTSLKHALIRIMHAPRSYKYINKYKNLLACPPKFIGLVPSKSLTLSSLVVKHSSLAYAEMHMGNFTLDNLKSLNVGIRYSEEYLDGLMNLLWLAPNLETLVVRFREDRRHCWVKGNQKGGSQAIGTWKSWYIECLSYHLKRVEITGVTGLEIVHEFVRFLLKNGKVLEKLEIQYRSEERKQKFFSKIVAGLPKASPKVDISLRVVHNQREFNWFQGGDSDPEGGDSDLDYE